MLNLTDAQKQRLKKRVKTDLLAREQDWADLQDELEKRYDLLEGVVEETDFPWRGASNLHIPIPLIYLKVYHTVARRSLLGSGRLWYIISGNTNIEDQLSDIEDGMNYKAFHEWNTAETVDSAAWNAPRDGLSPVFVSYRDDVEEVQDEIEVASSQEFLKEFPDAESAGMSQQEYESWAFKASQATVDDTVHIPITIQRIRYRGPWCDLVDLADFVVIPSTAPSLEPVHCRGYGFQYWVRKETIREMMDNDELDPDEAKLVLNARGGTDASNFMSAKRFAQRISESNPSTDVRLFRLTYRTRLTPGGPEQKLILIYNLENDALIQYKLYDLPADDCVLFRSGKRTNQLIGASLIGELRDLSTEVDALHNQRINSRSIAEVPSFVCRPSIKNLFDPSLPENKFRPGAVFWLENADAFKQFEVGGINFESSINEEDRTMKLASLVAGVDPFTFSGNPQPDNPDAPGNKTLYLISQSNLRMDDVLSSMRDGIEKLGEVLLAFERRYGPYHFSFLRPTWNGAMEEVNFQKSLLRSSGIRFAMAGTNVALNPESEFNRWFAIYNALTREPLFASNPTYRLAVLRRALAAGRIEGRDAYLPSAQQVEAIKQITENQAKMVEARRTGAQALQQEVSGKEAVVQQLRGMAGALPQPGGAPATPEAAPA